MSKCNRMKLQLTAAFDLGVVEASTQQDLQETKAQSAAATLPMSEINEYICLGSWRDAEEPENLAAAGITHVLNVAKEVPSQEESDAMARANVISKQIPMLDAHSEDIVKHFENAFAFIEQARAANGRVLVHCRRGISRSPAIVVAYLMRFDRMNYTNAHDFVKARRACVSLNLAFREMLEDYDPATPLGQQTAASRQSSQCMTEEDASVESDTQKQQPQKV